MTDFINDKVAAIAPFLKTVRPFLFIVIFCAGLVKGGYALIEHYLLHPPEGAKIADNFVEQDGGPEESQPLTERDYTIILERNLFGSVPENLVEESRDASDYADDLELTNLEIVLLGTVKGSEGTNRAIILDKGTNKQDLYETGDLIQSALIEKILRGKVILSFNGRDQMLDMSEAAKMRTGATSAKSPGKRSLQPVVSQRKPVAVAPIRSSPATVVRRTERIVRPKVIRPSRQIRTE